MKNLTADMNRTGVLLLLVVSAIVVYMCVYFMMATFDQVVLSNNDETHIEFTQDETIDPAHEIDLVSEDSTTIFDEFQDISTSVLEDGYTELDDGRYYNFEVDRIVSPIIEALKHTERTELPIVLWWTPFAGDAQGKIKRCDSGDCLFTTNRSLLNHPLTKALLFYGTDFNISDLPLPREAHHEWGLLHEESPKNQPMFLYDDILELFNHTSTFRSGSHYPITTQYIISSSYLLNPQKYTLEQKNKLKQSENLASVVYIQSGCNPPSDRDAYVAELQKYIRIDSYGECLHNRDLPLDYQDTNTMFSKGFVEILQKYKFIISFENAICVDYVTEKLYRTLFVGAIPIYRGAPNVRDWLPDNHSAIIADDFTSPQELAEYIRHVDLDADEYLKYMSYKEKGISNTRLKSILAQRTWGVDTPYKMSFITGFECHVCNEIHKNRQRVADGYEPVVKRGSHEHYGCPPPQKYDLPAAPGDEGWERDIWYWEYEQAKEKVQQLKELLQV